MCYQKVIRYGVLLWGIIFMLLVVIPNVNPELVGLIFIVGWSVLPHLVYLRITRNTLSLIRLLIPAILLCMFQLFLVRDYFNKESSGHALVFLVAPLSEGIVLAIGFLLAFLIGKIKPK